MPKRRKFSIYERSAVAQRANECCEYCISQADYSSETFEMEHILPLSLGGDNDLGNLANSCGGCNGRKRDKIDAIDPQTGQKAPLFNPRLDIWEEHFIWRDDFTIIEGISPRGRCTVALLELNRKGVVNLRRALRVIGDHPPLQNL